MHITCVLEALVWVNTMEGWMPWFPVKDSWKMSGIQRSTMQSCYFFSRKDRYETWHSITFSFYCFSLRSLNFLLFFQCVATPCFSFEKIEFNLRFVLNFEYNLKKNNFNDNCLIVDELLVIDLFLKKIFFGMYNLQ